MLIHSAEYSASHEAVDVGVNIKRYTKCGYKSQNSATGSDTWREWTMLGGLNVCWNGDLGFMNIKVGVNLQPDGRMTSRGFQQIGFIRHKTGGTGIV